MDKNKSRIDIKNDKQSLLNDVKLLAPEVRLQKCFDTGTNFPFELDTSILRLVIHLLLKLY